MRTLKRNKQSLYYSTFVSKTDAVDTNGHLTGGHVTTYSSPVLIKWNVRGVDADSEVEMFGIKAVNTIRVVAEKPLPIDSSSIIWYGKTPATPYVATAPGHNYRIAGILPTLNDAVFYAERIGE